MLLNTAVKSIKRESHRGDQNITTDQITLDIIACVNDTRRDLAKHIPKRYLHTVASPSLSIVQGTDTYSLASDCMEPIIFKYVWNNALYIPKKIDSDREWWANVYSPSQSQSFPKFYRQLGPVSGTIKRIQVFPIPDNSYTIDYEYYKDPCVTDLGTSDLTNEIPVFPGYLHDALWKGGLYYFLKGFDDAGTAQAKADYDAAVEKLNEADEQDQDTDLALRFGKRPSQDLGMNGMRIY